MRSKKLKPFDYRKENGFFIETGKRADKYKFFYHQRYPCISKLLGKLRSTSKNISFVIESHLEDEK